MKSFKNFPLRHVVFILKIAAVGVSIWLVTVGPLYIVAIRTGFQGMRGGPQDAFRHTFSSAIVSKYVSPQVVDVVTYICEWDDHSSHNKMDRHNNWIGRSLGMRATSLPQLYELVFTAVQNGKSESTTSEVVTWLPQDQWSIGL